MDCQTLRKTYDPSVDPSLEVQAHVGKCPVCSEHVRELREIRELLGPGPGIVVTRDFDVQLRLRIERLRKSPFSWWRFVSPWTALPVAATVLVAAVSLVILNTSKPSYQPGPPRSEAVATVVEQAKSDQLALQSESVPSQQDILIPHAPPIGNTVAVSGPGSFRDVAHPRPSRVTEDDRLMEERTPVLLRVRDELNQQERLVTIPSVVFGSEPVLALTRNTQSDLENVY